MARIRTIKPEFWTDGKIVSLSMCARLFFIGCWNFSRCDYGHLDDDAMGLKLKILPADNIDATQLLNELISAGLIVRLEHDGRSCLKIKRFEEHQKTDSRWDSRCPHCARRNSPKLAETHQSSPQERKVEEGKGKERKVEEGNIITSAGADPSPQVKNLELTHEAVKDLYHEHCPSLPRVSKMTARRIAAVKARIDEHPKPEFWIALLKRVEASDFLSRRAPPREGHENFRADFEWIVNVNNFTKILEGKYDNRGQRKAGNVGNNSGLAERARQIAGYLDDDEDPFSTGEKERHFDSGNCAETSNREMPNRPNNVFSEHGNHEGKGPNLQSCA